MIEDIVEHPLYVAAVVFVVMPGLGWQAHRDGFVVAGILWAIQVGWFATTILPKLKR